MERRATETTPDIPMDCVVLGAPRSGTSLVAGLIARSPSYRPPPDPLQPTVANPKGFFESRAILRINEDLLGQFVPISWRSVGRLLTPSRLRRGQLWLAYPEPGLDFRVPPRLRRRMKESLPRSPFVIKDPRFCHTLPAWKPVLGNPEYVVVFRNPAETVASILQEAERASYLSNLSVDRTWATAVWRTSYLAVLALEERLGLTMHFVHYEQLLLHDGVALLAGRLNADLDSTFVDRRLHRSRTKVTVADLPGNLDPIYRTLLDRAGYSPGKFSR